MSVFCLKAETHEGEIFVLRRGFTSLEEAEDHPVVLQHWKRVWAEPDEPKAERSPILPPFPWDWLATGKPTANGSFHTYLIDATGKKIAAIWGANSDKKLVCDFIVKAVNAAAPQPHAEIQDKQK
jgi:hypothetical protein